MTDAAAPVCRHFEPLRFYVEATAYSHYVEFRIFDVVGGEAFDLSTGAKLGDLCFPRVGAHSSADIVHTIAESEPYASGYVKWDGCSNWKFDEQERCMLHGCGREDVTRFGLILGECWDWAGQLMPETWDR